MDDARQVGGNQTESSSASADREIIRALVNDWVIWRDSGNWDRFRQIWHDDGRMMATWFQAPVDEFIEASKRGWARGLRVLHFLGGMTIDLRGDRSIAQTKMTVTQRDEVHGVLVDVVCTGRFFDFFEKRRGRWGLVLRQPIYESDRMNTVRPGAVLDLDQDLLNRFPEGYRHLAYLQSKLGFDVKRDMPGIRGSEVESLYLQGERWLAGEPVQWF